MNELDKTQKLWIIIFLSSFLGIVLFNVMISDINEEDISFLKIFVEIYCALFVCAFGYYLHSWYLKDNNNTQYNHMEHNNLKNDITAEDNHNETFKENYVENATNEKNAVEHNNYSSEYSNTMNNEQYRKIHRNTNGNYIYINLRNNVFALSSFISGIIGYFLVILAPLLGIASIILGVIGISSFDESMEKNKWMSVLGIIIGIFCILRQMFLFD